jgi:molecular chaperone GrpE (heat shock protein)
MLEDIEQKIATFQRENKEMRNQMEETRNCNEKNLDDIFLGVIEILDVFNREEKIIIDHEWNTSDDSKKVIKRYGNVRKKLQSFLSNYS